jgi:hypothetical protein
MPTKFAPSSTRVDPCRAEEPQSGEAGSEVAVPVVGVVGCDLGGLPLAVPVSPGDPLEHPPVAAHTQRAARPISMPPTAKADHGNSGARVMSMMISPALTSSVMMPWKMTAVVAFSCAMARCVVS